MDDETGIPASSPRRAAKLERRLARNCADTLTRASTTFGQPQLDFGQNLNGLAIDQGEKHRVHQFLYGHGQAETARKIAVVSTYPANALSPALSKLAKVELRSRKNAAFLAFTEHAPAACNCVGVTHGEGNAKTLELAVRRRL